MAFSTLTGAIRIDSSGVADGVDDAEQSLDSFAGKAESVGSRMQSAGKTLTMGVTAPLVAMAGAAVKSTARFDQAMARSLSVMGDVSDSMKQDLEATARGVASSTTVSASNAAEALYFLSSAGLSASESMEAMPQVAVFSEAAGNALTMADATDAATNVLNAYNYEASEMGEVTDTLSKAVSNHNQTLSGMSSALSQVAPVASSLGISLEETSAAVGLLGDSGISAEKAGTGLRSILIGLSDQASPLNKQLKEMGVQTQNAQGEMLPLTDVLQNMRDAGIDASDASKLFTREASAAGATLLEQAGSFDSATESIRNADGATEDMAKTQRQNLNSQLKNTRNNLENAAQVIGTRLIPMLTTLSGHVSGAAQWFQNLDNSSQNAIIAFGGLLAAAGPLLAIVGTIGVAVPALSAGFGALATAAGLVSAPILAIVAAVGLLGAAFATDFMGIRGVTQDAVGGVMDNLDLLKGAFLTFIGPVGWAYMMYESNLLGIQNRTAEAKDWVVNNLDLIVDGLLALMGPLGWVVVAYRRNIGGFGDATDEVVDDVVEGIDWLIERITQIPTELQNLIDRIPGVDGEEVADKLFPPKPAAEKAEETGEAAATAAKSGAEKGMLSADDSTQALVTGGEDPYSAGEDVGADIASGAMAGIDSEIGDGPIKGEMTSAMRSVLEDGVSGYVSDPEKIEDAPTKINENLFDAMSSTSKGATAERLGVSETEFVELMDRFGGGSGTGAAATSSSSGVSGPDLTNTSTSTGTGSVTAKDIATAVRDALADLVLEGELDVSADEFDRLVDARVRAVLDDEGDRLQRGSSA